MTIAVERKVGYAVVTITNPPVNAIGRKERQGLLEAVSEVSSWEGVKGVVVTGAGRAFSAGADTREFGGEPQPPHLPEVLNAIEKSPVPWIAAISGAALGGGLELALACAHRIASPTASLGLPEVKLGIVPGAGGTQRLPRLIGFGPAVSMISEGAIITADEAFKLGLVDEVDDDPMANAAQLASSGVEPTRDRLSERSRPKHDPEALQAALDRAAKKSRNEDAPLRAIELVELSTKSDFSDGARAERAAFLSLRKSTQAAALRHLFFAERSARSIGSTGSAGNIEQCAVVGGGTMGAGIAYALMQAGIRVRLIETDQPALQRARENVNKLVDDAQKRGLLNEFAAKQLFKRLTLQCGYDSLQDLDLAIEAVFEDMAVKKDVFRHLEAATSPSTILATNTSYLDINEIASSIARKENVIGLHFFSPPHIMRLVEVIVADATSDTVFETVFSLAIKLKKLPVPAGVCDGFIGNRILARYRETADMMLLDGALPWEIDEAMVEFGYPMGPYAAQDIAGLDIAHANRKRQAATRDPSRRYIPIGDRMVAEGRLGRKVGVGWYRYPGGRGPVIDPLLEDLIAEESRFAKVVRRPFSGEEVRKRLLAAMINEAAEILREGIARRAEDVDLVTVHGYGFPRWRGGLLFFARSYGIERVIRDIASFSYEDPVYWQPSAGLLKLAASDKPTSGS
jgi:3-hydroxyacyl-CoA dehydrogenase